MESSSRNYARGIGIAGTAMIFTTAMAASIVLLFAMRLVRRQKNPMRSWVTLYRVAFGSTLWLFSFTSLVGFIPPKEDRFQETFMASFQLSSISGLTGSLTDVLVLLALLKLAFCIKLLHAGEALTVDQALRIVSLVFATILGIFHVVHFGLREWESTSYGAALLPVLISSQGRDLLSFIESALEYVLLLLVLFLPTDIIIRLWARSSQKVKKTTMYLVVCGALMFVRVSYFLCDSAITLTGHKFVFLTILSIILAVWPLVAIFALLFRLG